MLNYCHLYCYIDKRGVDFLYYGYEFVQNVQLVAFHVKQMTDARCRRCQEKQVGLLDIIQAGGGARYQVLPLSFLYLGC